ncbi:hypothetical protein L208DRAFT_1551598 [Tricholoma matsutake]|nr:hypothetical protein L208DRAFT_1551598 [Tricholoma matsutake 945]
MKMALPAFMPTLKSHSTGNHTWVDNVFCSEGLIDSIIKCTMDNTTRSVKMDHYPIITQLSIIALKTTSRPRPNFRLANWPKLIVTLEANLTNLALPMEIIDTQSFDKTLSNLNNAIQDAIEKHIEISKPSPYSKRWWLTELVSKKKKMQQLGGRAKYQQANPDHLVHKEYW